MYVRTFHVTVMLFLVVAISMLSTSTGLGAKYKNRILLITSYSQLSNN